MQENKLNLIKQTLPELPIISTKFIESGYHSLAIILNDEWVFRFPLNPKFYDEYIQEEKTLDLIRPHIKTQIPQLTIHKVKDTLFTQHKMITGIQYTWAGSKITDIQKEKLAVDLASFLAQMHQTKFEDSIKQFSFDDYPIYQNEFCFKDVFSDDEVKKLYNVLSGFEKTTKTIKPTHAVLCHTDLNENNFLIEYGRLKGVIDFGNACVRDYSSEFAALLKHDFKLAKEVAKQYEKITNRPVNFDYAILIQKLRCYGGILESKEDIKRVKRYKKWLKYIEKNENF